VDQYDLNQDTPVPLITSQENFGEAPLVADPSQLVPVVPTSKTRPWRRNIGAATLAILLIGAVTTILKTNVPKDPKASLIIVPATSPSTDLKSRSIPNDGVSDSPTRQAIVSEKLKAAKANWDAANFQQVVDACDEVLAIEPAHERAIYVRALAYAELGNSRQAVEDHLSLQKQNSKLFKQGSNKLVNAYIEVVQLGRREARELMLQGHLSKSNLRLDQCVQLCDYALQFAPSANEINSLRTEARIWKETCDLAIADRSGLISSSLKLREWRDRTEIHTITARFVEIDEKVRLERADGTKAAIKLDQLSIDDQRWLDQLIKRKAEVRMNGK